MVLGVVTWELHINGCRSLKEKRRVLKSLKDRLHRQYNISVAETNYHDRWQKAELSGCVVSTERRHAESVLSAADQLVGRDPLARIIDSTTNFL